MAETHKVDSPNDEPLHFSGLSEDLESPTRESNGSMNNLASGYHSDLDDHVVTPVSGAKAARKVENHEHMLSDDECPKVLTTLEPVKKASVPTKSKQAPMVEHEEDEGSVLLELSHDDHTNNGGQSTSTPKIVMPSARIQLVDLNSGVNHGRVRKFSTIERKVTVPKKFGANRHSIDTASIVEAKRKHITADKSETKNIVVLNKVATPKVSSSSPHSSSGIIEIPTELLLAEADIPTTPVILNHVNTSTKMDNDELIAILEGDGDSSTVEHFEVDLDGNDCVTVPVNAAQNTGLSKEQEREIAMHQMLNLPVKKKGRPRLDPSQKKVPTKSVKQADANTTKNRKIKAPPTNNQLINDLVSDWNDEETAVETETDIVIEISAEPPAPKKRLVEVPQPTFKRQRIIKKKVIWDPDAPETAINYASFAHTSGPGPQKKSPIRKLIATESTSNAVKDTSVSPVLKKKKISEIDRLLGDEGAKNMLDSINKSESPTAKPSRKIIRPEPYDSVIHAIANARPRRKDQAKQSPVKEATMNPPKKRAAAASSSWDYVYSARPDDSMIIRRRSNSSYSSTASPNRSSLDMANAPAIIESDVVIEPSKKKGRLLQEDRAFEFVKPIAKKPIKIDSTSAPTILNDIRGKFNKAISGEIKTPIRVKDTIISPIIRVKTEIKSPGIPSTLLVSKSIDSVLASYSELTLKWHKHCTQLILSPLAAGDGGRFKNFFTIQLMKEISSALMSLDLDKKCKCVLITSANNSFCGGIDFTTLVQPTAEKRKTAALELAKTTRYG